MKKLFVVLFFLFLSLQKAFSNVEVDTDFLDEPTENDKIQLKENKTSRMLSVQTIRLARTIDKYLLKPSADVYDVFTTESFQMSFHNLFYNVLDGIRIPNAIFIFSADRFIVSFGGVLINSTTGLVGTANITKELNVSDTKTEIIDIMRFYNAPEMFFFTLGGVFNFTLPYLIRDSVELYFLDRYNLTFGLFIDLVLYTINERALNPAPFELLQRIDPEFIYEALKAKTQVEARNFKIERHLFANKKSVLAEAYNKYDDFF